MKEHQIPPIARSRFGYVMVRFKVDSGIDLVARLKVVSNYPYA